MMMTTKKAFLKEVKSAALDAPRLFFAPLTGAFSGAIKEVTVQLHRGDTKAMRQEKAKRPVRA